MSIEITHVHTEPVHQSSHEVITHYAWREIETGNTGSFTKPDAVAWVRRGGQAFVGSGTQQVPVGVHERPGVEPYLQTYADGVWSNNLLNLPRY